MNYFCIPQPMEMRDLMTNKVTDTMTFATIATAMCASLASKQAMDALEIIDLRAKLTREPGTWVELTEPEYKAIETEFKRPPPSQLTPQAILQMGPFIRAILDAPRERPAASIVNGAQAVS